jgi:C-terminal processing protease CtpA/Prc
VTSDSSIKLTIAKWLTPNGLTISGNGLTPSIIATTSTSTIVKAGSPEDVQLNKAIEIVKNLPY